MDGKAILFHSYNMQFLVFLCLASVAFAAPQYRPSSPQQPAGGIVNIALKRSSPDEPIIIIKQVQDQSPDGSYSFSYETENGIQVQEEGHLKNEGRKDEALEARGAYSFVAPDNNVYSVSWQADENGFVAQGAHLPTPPPIPVEIQKALDYIRSLPPNSEK